MFTIVIKGGMPVQMQIPNNPLLIHNGGTTVVHVVTDNLQELREALEAVGCLVESWPSRAERSPTEVLPEVQVPCLSCPSCPWFDPLQVDLCAAYGGVPEESFEILLERENYRKALSVCPLRKMK